MNSVILINHLIYDLIFLGDEQLAIDILANNVIFQNLRNSGAVATASSEETPTEDSMGGNGYSVAFDPLDGSSVIDTNFGKYFISFGYTFE